MTTSPRRKPKRQAAPPTPPSPPPPTTKTRAQEQYRVQVQKLREEAILAAVHRMLATKGYDFMTVDAVASEAGMAKASLYKYFSSKEQLAAAAMIRVLDLSLAEVNALRAKANLSAIDKLKAVTRWAMASKLRGDMPSLPAQNSQLSNSLQNDPAYMERLFELSTKLSIWVSEAQNAGTLRAEIPVEMFLYMIFARACDPVLDMMHSSGRYATETILDWMVLAHFSGMATLNQN